MHPIERLRSVVRASPEHATHAAREAAAALSTFDDDPAGLVVACRRLVAQQPVLGVMWWVASTILASPEPARAAWQAMAALDADATAEAIAAELPAEGTAVLLGRPGAAFDALALRPDVSGVLVGLDDITGRRRPRRSRIELDWAEPEDLPDILDARTVVLVDVVAYGASGWVGPGALDDALQIVRDAGTDTWGVAGAGRLLPPLVLRALLDRLPPGPRRSAFGGHLDDDETPPAPWVLRPLALLDAIVGPDAVLEVAEALGGPTCPVAPELLRFGT